MTLMKFYVPHVSVSFGPGGQLVCVCPSAPKDGQVPLVELHSMEVGKQGSVPEQGWHTAHPATLDIHAPLCLSMRISKMGDSCGNWATYSLDPRNGGLFSERSDARAVFSLRC